MVIENGVLVPYSEEEAATPAGEAPEAELNESETNSEGSELNENTNADVDSGVQTIEESADLSKHSSVVQSLISQMNFSKGGF